MIRDFWVYQRRQNAEGQWALYVVMDYTPHLPETVTLDFALYSDKIKNSAKSVSFGGYHRKSVKGYIEDILPYLVEVSHVTTDDVKQLEEELLAILQHV